MSEFAVPPGLRLKAERERRGLSAQKAADEMHLDRWVIDALEADDELFVRINARTLRNTALGNFLGWCGVSFPTGTDSAGLPTALLLSGAPATDDRLLSFSLTAEPLIRDVAE